MFIVINVIQDPEELPFIENSKINPYTIDAKSATKEAFDWILSENGQLEIPENDLTIIITRLFLIIQH